MAFNYIYRLYATAMFQYWAQVSPDEHVLQECIQNIFIDLRRKCDGLSKVQTIRDYLLKILFDPLEITGWKDKVLVFKKSSLSDVKKKVEHWFGVQVQLNGNVDMDRSYFGIYKDETLENVLRGIFFSSGLSYKIEEKSHHQTAII